MKLGMNLYLWTTNAGPEVVALLPELKKAGFDGVEIPIARRDSADLEEIRRALDGEGLECTTITNVGADANPVAEQPEGRARAVDELKWAVDSSLRLGSERMSGPFFAAYGVFTGTGPTEQELDRSAEVLGTVCRHAQGSRLVLCLEFLNRFETYLLNTTAQTASLIDRVGVDNLAILYDTHHAHHEEDDIADAIVRFRSKIGHVHFSESHRGMLGGGLADWTRTVQALKSAPAYDDWIVLEAFSTDMPDLARAAHVWRNTFESKTAFYTQGARFVRDLWASA